MSLRRSVRSTRIETIARREFRVTVQRREFIAITLGLPLLYAVMFAIVFGATVSAVGSGEKRQSRQSPPVIGFYDATHRLDSRALEQTMDNFTGRCLASEAAGLSAIRSAKARAFVSVSADFYQTGDVTVYTPPAPISLGGTADDGTRLAYVRLVRMAALSQRVDSKSLALALLQIQPESRVLDRKSGKFAPPDPMHELARFVVPYAVSLLLLLSVLLASSYVLHGIVEEKENRVIEILVSSVTHEELLLGKLIGLGGAGLAQLSVWLICGVSLTTLLKPASLAIGAPPVVLGCALLMFGLGYSLYASIMAGIGSLGTSWRESQHIASLGAAILIIPLLFLPVFLDDPDCLTARLLSLFPLTAPIALPIRVAAGGGSILDTAFATLLLIVSIVSVLRISARLFRLAVLMQGQRPNLAGVLRALCAAS